MGWFVFLYFPIGCLVIGEVGSWVLRAQRTKPGLILGLCRLVLLCFPFLLLLVLLGRPVGPRTWLLFSGRLPGGTLVVGCIAGMIGVRWVGEMIAGQVFQWRLQAADVERPAPEALLAALDYQRLQSEMAPPRYLAWLPRPRIFLSKATNAGHLTSGLFPRLCLDASLVPQTYREQDLWWQTVLQAPVAVEEGLEPLRAVVAHELAHFKRSDHLRTFMATMAGALLPWEWLFERSSLRRTFIRDTWPLRWWSRLMAPVGAPMRRWLREDRHIRELLADQETNRVVAQGSEHLRKIRSLYSADPSYPATRVTHAMPLPISGFLMLTLVAAVLGCAPGRLVIQEVLGLGLIAADLPPGWCLNVAGRSKASAIYIPGHGTAGEVLVDCQKVDPSQPPDFRAVGRHRPGALPTPCVVELRWDVHYNGPGQLSGGESVMSLTQSASMVRENPDLVAAYSIPAEPAGGKGSGWLRYSLTTRIDGHPQMDILYICYTFPAPGRYLFRPPTLSLLLPDNRRIPYPRE